MKKASLIRAGAIYLLCIAVVSSVFSMLPRIMSISSNSLFVIIGYLLVAVGAAGKRKGLMAAAIACVLAAVVQLSLILLNTQTSLGWMGTGYALLLLPINAAAPIFYMAITRRMKTVWRALAICAVIAAVLQAVLSAYSLSFAGSIEGRVNIGQTLAMLGTIGSALSVAQTALKIAIMAGVAAAPNERLLPAQKLADDRGGY